MAIVEEDFIVLAENLLSGEHEVEWRSSASRAYYAAYHMALKQVIAWDTPSSARSKGVHERTISKFTSSQDKELVALGHSLTAMKKVRSCADYRLHEEFSNLDAASQLAMAKVFMREASDKFSK